ncbi:MAG: hypothetical protein ACFFAN_06465 [Promethearchaeota archaeon]
MAEINKNSRLKIRKLTELKPTTAQEYQDSMLKRVKYFSEKRESSFNSLVENTIVSGLKFLLDLKVKADEILGNNQDKVHDVLEKLILFGI